MMSRSERHEIALQLSVCAYFGDVPVEEGLALVEQAHRLQGDSPSAHAMSLRVTGGLLGMAGRFEDAHDAVARSNAIFEELGTPMAVVGANQATAETLRLEGRLEEADQLLREMTATYDSIGETGFNSTVCGLLANTLCDLERYEEAERYATRSRELAADDDFASQASWRMAQARVLADRGALEGALRLADEAVEILGQTDYIVWQGDGFEVKGFVLVAAGRRDDARAVYEESLARYERKGNVVAAARIRARLQA
jgi:tetratricopeptide (TPR) repeat protein